MSKKLTNSAAKLPIHRSTQPVTILAGVIFLAMLLIWSSNYYKIIMFFDFYWTIESPSQILDNYHLLNELINRIPIISSVQNVSNKSTEPTVAWVSLDHLEENYTAKLMSRCCLENEDVSSNGLNTVDIKFLNIDDEKPIVLSAGNAHEVFFQTLDEFGNNRNYGGDYFEINLAGERWRSRPPLRDIGNGTYSFTLQVHPDFAGDYNLTISIIYRNFGGLRSLFPESIYNKKLRNISILFLRSGYKLDELHLCKKSDFKQGYWTGRWTRFAKNDTCEISDDGRYRCLEPDHPCTLPWCNGSLGMLESNGWVYSTHCSFVLFSIEDAWRCLNNSWLFFWGDSTNVDTIHNMLFFNLGVPQEELDVITRHFDKTFTNPKDMSQKVRITQFWNAHYNVTENFLGLKTLTYKHYRDSLMSFFKGRVVPDTILINSGLHDGYYCRNLNQYSMGVSYAISFWKQIIKGIKKRGLKIPNFIYRSTVASSSLTLYNKGINPSKMEAFNWIFLEKIKASGLTTNIIDYFDMTWPWHFDLRCTDGAHYGRFPSKSKWKDGQIGHQYFVDLMVGHVILNIICPM